MTLRTSNISSPNLSSVDNVEGGGGDVVGDRVESGYGWANWLVRVHRIRQFWGLPKVPEHHGGRKDHSGRVSPVCSHNIASDMSAAWLEKSVFLERVN